MIISRKELTAVTVQRATLIKDTSVFTWMTNIRKNLVNLRLSFAETLDVMPLSVVRKTFPCIIKSMYSVKLVFQNYAQLVEDISSF